ncbi:MAG: hypothetical protein C5B53_04230 [Candidatus Melainabacteria bacterium]|nr:MAG: hypothetical protein C5B53_04230 [Candidatus Melainabacteria bacterium]
MSVAQLFCKVFIGILIVASLTGCSMGGASGSTDLPSSLKLTKVRFGMLPYGDHTYAIIGVKKGWFKEAGIDLDYQCVKVEDVVPFLKGGSLDVASVPPGILLASYETAPNLVSFALSDLFQGYCIMGQPDSHCKSYMEMVSTGAKPEEAIKKAAQQLRGKVFAYPAEAAIKPFIDLVVQKSGLQRRDFKSLVLDDALTINAMRNKQADFQVGGAPSQIILRREGFKPILSAIDLAKTANPSPNSPELASILEDGWGTTHEYFQKNHDTVLRLAGVNFRIMKFMHDHQPEALALHMPYLSQVTGQHFSDAEGKIIYEDLDPFYTFEEQREWFHKPKSLYYFQNVNGAILNNYISQHIYQRTPPHLDTVLVARDVYDELDQLRKDTEENLAKVDLNSLTEKEKAKYKIAKSYYDAYDFLDADRIARELSLESKK